MSPRCQEPACDRPAEPGSLRCALHGQRLGSVTRPLAPSLLQTLAALVPAVKRRASPAVPRYVGSLVLVPAGPLALWLAYADRFHASDSNKLALLAAAASCIYAGVKLGFSGLQRSDGRVGRWAGALLTLVHGLSALPIGLAVVGELAGRLLKPLFID